MKEVLLKPNGMTVRHHFKVSTDGPTHSCLYLHACNGCFVVTMLCLSVPLHDFTEPHSLTSCTHVTLTGIGNHTYCSIDNNTPEQDVSTYNYIKEGVNDYNSSNNLYAYVFVLAGGLYL